METFLDFFSFSDPNVRYVVLGSILITASSAIVGSFTFLKKKALVGDAVAHAVLPGVCV
ncbi:metal ABC transporter permease [Fulvivirga sp.]|uniref:metal ABC transporter permease n=1 Tax=Fulvivirga sp. TaxID=1931237 RepID=UPI0032EECB9D